MLHVYSDPPLAKLKAVVYFTYVLELTNLLMKAVDV